MITKYTFLKYLQEMDIAMLEEELDDSCIYFGASKKVFLEKLVYIFNQFKLTGGVGNLRIKQHKNHKNTFYLLIPHFNFTNKLIIEEHNNEIVNISNGRNIKNDEDYPYLNPIELSFGDDERADFKPSEQYTATLLECQKAYNEIVKEEKNIMSASEIENWINKYTLLFEEVTHQDDYFKFKDFRNLYESFRFHATHFEHYPNALIALNSFGTLPIRKWLNRFHNLFFYDLSYLDHEYKEMDEINKTLKCKFYQNLFFKGDDFITTFKFSNLYYKHLTRFEINDEKNKQKRKLQKRKFSKRKIDENQMEFSLFLSS